MAVLNPYRSMNATESRAKTKLPSISISRVVIIVVLLVFTAVTFFIHEAYSEVHAESGGLGIAKISLNRLRGQFAPALKADADLQKKGTISPKAESEGADGTDTTKKDEISNASLKEEALKMKKMEDETAKIKIPPVPSVDPPGTSTHASTGEKNTNEKDHAHRAIHKLDMSSKGVKEGSPESNKHANIPEKGESLKGVVPPVRHELKTVEKDDSRSDQAALQRKETGGATAHLDEAPAAVAGARRRQQLDEKSAAASSPKIALPQIHKIPVIPAKHYEEPPVDPHKVVVTSGPKPHNVEPAARPPNPYDPPATVKKAQAEKRARQEMKAREALQHMTCDGTIDPFEDLPVESWKPPASAKLEDKLSWKRKVEAMLQKIKTQKVGGKALRKLIDEEVDKLKVERVEMFCKAFVKDRDGGQSS